MPQQGPALFDDARQAAAAAQEVALLTLQQLYDRRAEDQADSRNGYERGRLRTAEGFVDVSVL